MEKNYQKLQWKGYSLDFSAGPVVMGILNVTTDSFSDGGLYLDVDKAIMRGAEMAGEGAGILDIGPASTRPGAQPVPADEQIRRAIPVIERLKEMVNVPLSIDTYDVAVAREAVKAGASMINDITALSDEKMSQLAAEEGVAVVLMHMRGTPASMQDNPQYADVVKEVRDYLLCQAKAAQKAGIKEELIFIDPGIGFGKTVKHNLLLLKHLDEFVKTGYKVLTGTSRKRFIGQIIGQDEPGERVFGTAATVGWAVEKGVSVVRVHDVRAMCDVVKIVSAIRSAK